MGELLQQVKMVSEQFGDVVSFILIIGGVLYLIERAINIYKMLKLDRRERRKEDFAVVGSLVGGDRYLELLHAESKFQEAFFRETGLNLNKKDRENILELYFLVSMRSTDLKHLYYFVEKAGDGKFKVQITIAELFQLAATILIALIIAITGVKVMLSLGSSHVIWLPIILFATILFVFAFIFMSRASILEWVVVCKVADRLAGMDKLIGNPGFLNQVKGACKQGWKSFVYIVLGVVILVLVADVLL
ncbi:hypothetical protein [Chromobacterium sp. IRSSSOUMB001]|uniref:hypothetical protein n=1 Tax=Chromobacterium sp. IRSSSOUMB001 TaxID=2927123 RepID=UPI0020BFDF0D|nr:hypothetical protein [Chromobacterium sp. IRSSSOUMB001]